MPVLTDRSIDLDEACRIASDWHGGQASAVYALASSGHVSGDALREAWQAWRERYPWSRNVTAQALKDLRDLAALIRYLRVEAFYTVDVCVGCYYVHHYGDLDDYARSAECVTAYVALGGDQYVTDATNSETGEGIATFSWSSCDCCGSTLGGSRYALSVERH